ncbi:MAG: signal peptidase II [Alistipes sp.]|nr:signal peptidase II [Alistipes sp.]MBR7169104.1 signal peptidase II [Alistipes sp.]
MNLKKKTLWLVLLIVLLLVADQVLKIWVKTHFTLGESMTIIPDWFQLRFIENPGFAFGLRIGSGDGFDWGKLGLGIFRIVLSVGIGWLMVRFARRASTPTGVLVGLALILAGAVGNIIDSACYGWLFSESTPQTVAEFGGSYAAPMMGKVVDMCYFPLFRWESAPSWLSFLFDREGYFFGPIFNLADAYISVAVVYLLIFHHKFLSK